MPDERLRHISMNNLPEFLRHLPVVNFYRRMARTRAESEQSNVIFGVISLDDLFLKAKQRGLMAGSSEQQSQSSSFESGEDSDQQD